MGTDVLPSARCIHHGADHAIGIPDGEWAGSGVFDGGTCSTPNNDDSQSRIHTGTYETPDERCQAHSKAYEPITWSSVRISNSFAIPFFVVNFASPTLVASLATRHRQMKRVDELRDRWIQHIIITTHTRLTIDTLSVLSFLLGSSLFASSTMLASFRPTCACVSLALLIASVACAMPSASASAPPVHPDKVTDLPGLSFTPTFNHYSGYIPLPDSPTMMHYWFVESQGDPATDPVVLWLNGGPGCSSMMGMLTENGPFSIQSDGATIDLNPYAWNRYASFIYLESPSGVGFSYGTTNNYTSGDVTTARDNYNFLQAFFKEYSEFAKQRFYIAGTTQQHTQTERWITRAYSTSQPNNDVVCGNRDTRLHSCDFDGVLFPLSPTR